MTESPNILISRCDSIGDVVLTLPMAGLIKARFPKARVIFLGRTYTRDVVALCEHVDEFLNYDELKHLPRAEQIEVFKKGNRPFGRASRYSFKNRNVEQVVPLVYLQPEIASAKKKL